MTEPSAEMLEAKSILDGCLFNLEIAEDAAARFAASSDWKQFRIAVVFGRECTMGHNKLKSRVDGYSRWFEHQWAAVFENDQLLRLMNEIRTTVSHEGLIGRANGKALFELVLSDPTFSEVPQVDGQFVCVETRIIFQQHPGEFGGRFVPGMCMERRCFLRDGTEILCELLPMTVSTRLALSPIEHRGQVIEGGDDLAIATTTYLETIRGFLDDINHAFFDGQDPKGR
jgi:hypothetical protein